MKKLIPLLVLLASSRLMAYDIVERTKLIDDRWKTMEMLRPYGHDFYFDFSAGLTTDAMNLADDAQKIGDIEDGTVEQQIEQANTILAPYYDKEQVLRARLGLGFPIFSFAIGDWDIKPNFRIDAGLTAVITPTSEMLSLETVIDQGLVDVPDSIKTALKSCLTPSNLSTLTDGEDILVWALTAPGCTLTSTDIELIKKATGITKLPYSPVFSTLTTQIQAPLVDAYAKADVVAGPVFTFSDKKHFFGTVALNALARADVRKSANALILLGDGGDLTDVKSNLMITETLNVHFGYKNDNYQVMTALEEVKLGTIKDDSEDGTPIYGTDPLFRLHAQADYRLGLFKVSPYLGSHARSGYSLGDAYYLGADWGLHLWKDRLSTSFRTMLDKEHVTLGARLKLIFFQLELLGKIPVTSKVDGVKVNEQLAANIRFFF